MHERKNIEIKFGQQ